MRNRAIVASMKNTRMVRRVVLSSLVCIGLTGPLRAQIPVATFQELRTSMKLKEGETIEVTEANGAKYKARIAELSETISVMTATGARRDLTESQVRQIRHWPFDKLWNGMLIGTAVGMGVGLAIGTGEACESGSCIGRSVAIFSGIGLGTGAVIDLATRKQEIVYSNPRGGPSRSMRIYPVLNKNTASVGVSLRF